MTSSAPPRVPTRFTLRVPLTRLWRLACSCVVSARHFETSFPALFRQSLAIHGHDGMQPIIEKGEAVFGEYERLAVIDRKYAKYTLEAKRQGTEGQILIRALIDAHGKVADTEVLRGLPNGLTEEALQALRKSKFQPARLNGEPVGAIYHQSVDMRLTPALVSQHRIGGDSDNH